MLTFRIYPEPRHSRLYFTVHVFEQLAELRAFAMASSRQAPSYFRRSLGVCQTWRDRRDRECGQILFAETHLRPDVISHEAGHALIGWAARRDVPLDRWPAAKAGATEERACYALGELVGQIFTTLAARGVPITPIRTRQRRGGGVARRRRG